VFDLSARLKRLLGATPLKMTEVTRGYTAASRLLVEFSDGRRAFVKVATDALTAGWLRDEYRIYKHVQGSFMPAMLAWEDGEHPLLVLEDLSLALWPQSWTNKSIAAVLDTLKLVGDSPVPKGMPSLETLRPDPSSWRSIAANPENFLSLKLCTARWLENALPTLIEVEESAILSGSKLLHLDVRSDNICFVGNRVVLVDWNWACVGNSLLEIVFWLPSVHLEGGPLPEQIVAGEPSLVAFVAGFWACRAGLPPPYSGATVRDLQLRQLKVALPWCAKLLQLPPLNISI